MATVTAPSTLSPAAAQPISLTGAYLSWGYCQFATDSTRDTIARGFYSLGVIVLAPVGMLYHFSCAAYAALSELRLEEGKEQKALSNWRWQHLDAAISDAIGVVHSLIFPALLGCLVAFSALAMKGKALRGAGYLIPFLAFLIESETIHAIMPYSFATDASPCLGAFLSHAAPEGGKSSQASLHEMYHSLARVPYFQCQYDAPVTDEETCAFFTEVYKKAKQGDQFRATFIYLPEHLQKFKRADAKQVDWFVSNKAKIEEIAGNGQLYRLEDKLAALLELKKTGQAAVSNSSSDRA